MAESSAMTCHQLVELVTDYLEGSLASMDRERFEAHLGACTGCHNYLDQMRTTIALTGRVTEDSIPTEARATLLQWFRDWKRGE